MRHLSCCLIAVLAIGLAASADAQPLLKMKVKLGTPTEFEVDVEYHDPGELDERLHRSRVLPVWLAVTNVSKQKLPFDYKDVRLDLGTAGGQTPLAPVDADEARRFRRRRDAGPTGESTAGLYVGVFFCPLSPMLVRPA